MLTLRLIRSACAAAFLAATAITAHAAYPDRPIHFVVPFPAGGGTDIVARLVADKMASSLGQPIIVENKAGAGTIIGTEAVARAQPDGYTLLYTSSAFSVNPSLIKNIPYDPEKSFKPVGLAAFHPFVLLVNPKLPVHTIKELIDYAKKNPGKLNYASVGVGSSQHLAMELFKRMAGVDIQHIPYKGSAPAVTDLLGGQVMLMFNGISPTLGYIRSGKLRALATDSEKPVPLLGGVPTVSDSGLPGFKITTWSGLLAPAGTPQAVVEQLAAAMSKAVESPDFQSKLQSMGLQPAGMAPAQFAAFLREDVAEWAKLVKDSGAQPN